MARRMSRRSSRRGSRRMRSMMSMGGRRRSRSRRGGYNYNYGGYNYVPPTFGFNSTGTRLMGQGNGAAFGGLT